MNRVAVKVGGAVLEFGEVLDRAQAALRAVNLLVEEAAQAHRIEPEAPLLRPVVRIEVELAGRVAVDMAVQAGDAEAGLGALAVVGGVEFFLRERRQQQAQAVELHGREEVFEEAMEIVDRNDFAARDVAQLRTVLQKDGRREFREEGVGQVEVHVEPLEPRKHEELHLRERPASGGVLRMRQRRIGEQVRLSDGLGRHLRQALPAVP